MYELQTKATQTFKSFDDAIEVLEKTERQDYLANSFNITNDGRLGFSFGDGQHRELHFTEIGLRRMLRELKIPESFAFRVVDNHLLTDNIQQLMANLGSSQVVSEKIHGDEFITGFRKSYVAPLRDHEVLNVLRQRLSSNGIHVRHLTRSIQDFRLHYANTNQNLDYLHNNQAISMGGEVVFSEYGSKPMTSKAALLIQWCTNGCVLDESIYKSTFKHDGDRYKAVEAVNRSVEGLLMTGGEALPEVFNKMKLVKPTEKMFKSIRSRTNKLLPEEMFDSNCQDDMSYWNMFQEVTRMAHENATTTDNRRALEIVGGSFITAVGKEENYRPLVPSISNN